MHGASSKKDNEPVSFWFYISAFFLMVLRLLTLGQVSTSSSSDSSSSVDNHDEEISQVAQILQEHQPEMYKELAFKLYALRGYGAAGNVNYYQAQLNIKLEGFKSFLKASSYAVMIDKSKTLALSYTHLILKEKNEIDSFQIFMGLFGGLLSLPVDLNSYSLWAHQPDLTTYFPEEATPSWLEKHAEVIIFLSKLIQALTKEKDQPQLKRVRECIFKIKPFQSLVTAAAVYLENKYSVIATLKDAEVSRPPLQLKKSVPPVPKEKMSRLLSGPPDERASISTKAAKKSSEMFVSHSKNSQILERNTSQVTVTSKADGVGNRGLSSSFAHHAADDLTLTDCTFSEQAELVGKKRVSNIHVKGVNAARNLKQAERKKRRRQERRRSSAKLSEKSFSSVEMTVAYDSASSADERAVQPAFSTCDVALSPQHLTHSSIAESVEAGKLRPFERENYWQWKFLEEKLKSMFKGLPPGQYARSDFFDFSGLKLSSHSISCLAQLVLAFSKEGIELAVVGSTVTALFNKNFPVNDLDVEIFGSEPDEEALSANVVKTILEKISAVRVLHQKANRRYLNFSFQIEEVDVDLTVNRTGLPLAKALPVSLQKRHLTHRAVALEINKEGKIVFHALGDPRVRAFTDFSRLETDLCAEMFAYAFYDLLRCNLTTDPSFNPAFNQLKNEPSKAWQVLAKMHNFFYKEGQAFHTHILQHGQEIFGKVLQLEVLQKKHSPLKPILNARQRLLDGDLKIPKSSLWDSWLHSYAKVPPELTAQAPAATASL